ncbi:hypothetical protein BDP27DRAFT_1429104 [Rhodocollybia butyracea]|uniref:Fungal-type protein kinase domain-containing protein n=1 Tax=Rhodocollybia butyracea TaxID=206335 RepID=A0A9P5TZ89_9AGAR|nr:hypothetical protein BDP27DRAFT_1429104 [Rhodocollybia butyracea]
MPYSDFRLRTSGIWFQLRNWANPIRSAPAAWFQWCFPNKVQTKILQIYQELKIVKDCNGFVIDRDMAVNWRHYFSEGNISTKSGTSEFMSDQLLNPNRKNYVRSPLDDYRSLFYVTQWACAFHELSPEDSPKSPALLQQLRTHLTGDRVTRQYATSTMVDMLNIRKDKYGIWLAEAQPFLRDWNASLSLLGNEWVDIVKSRGHNSVSFRQCADLGLLVFLEIARKHIHLLP